MADLELKDFTTGGDIQLTDKVYSYRSSITRDVQVTNVLSKSLADAAYIPKVVADTVTGALIPGISGMDISSITSAPEGFMVVSNDNSLGIDGSLAIWHDGQMRTYWAASDISTYVGAQLTQYQEISEKNDPNGYAGLDGSGKLFSAQIPALTGDVTTNGTTTATTIAANAVTYPKIQQVGASSLLGNSTGAAANAQEITLGAGLSFSGATLTATGSTAPVQSVFSRTGVVMAQSGDYTFAQISGTPTTLAGYGITDGLTISAAASTYQALSQKDQALGYPGLDASGKINPLQLPAIAITETFVVASQAAMLALVAQTGDVAVRTDLSETFILQGSNPAVLSDWVLLQTPASPVQSVFGRLGVVTAQANDYTFSQIGSTPTTLTGYGITLSGDVSNSSNAITIVANAVTYAKFQQVAAASLIGNPTGSTGNSQAITLGAGLAFSGSTLVTTNAALTKTNDTNVTLTLGGSPSTALVNAASLTLGWTGQLSLTRGGTAASLTASNGGIIYSTASAMAVLSGTATANQVLLSGSSAAPAWSTATYPASTSANQLLYSSSANTIAELATANRALLFTSATGVPTIGSKYVDSSGTTNNLFIGTSAGSPGATGTGNTSVGILSFTSSSAGLSNTAFGYGTLRIIIAGDDNTVVGHSAASLRTTYRSCVFLGSGADASVNALTNAIAIGYNASVGADNTIVLGNTSIVSCIIGNASYPTSTTANQLLYSSATNTITGLATANSSILVTDGSGVPSLSGTLPFTVPVTTGGTGVASATAYAVLCGGTTSTGALQSVSSVGTAGQLLQSNGAGALPTWAAVTGTGAPVLANTPTLVTPVLGAATATSINFGQTSLNFYQEGSWTPIDVSGAGLGFSGVSGFYTRIGNTVIANCQLAFPSTVNGANAQIGGLPFAASASAGKTGGGITYSTIATARYALVNISSTAFLIYTTAGVLLTNANMSTGTMRFQIIYQI